MNGTASWRRIRERRQPVRDILPPASTRPPRLGESQAGRPGEAGPTTKPAGVLTPARAPLAPAGVRAQVRETPEELARRGGEPVEGISIRTWEPEALRRARTRRRVLIGGLAGILLLGFIGPLATFPSITVSIQPKIEELPIAPIELEATPAISAPDVPTGRIPAARLTIESEAAQDYRATGERYVEERARGVITISNAFSSSPQTLVANTRFRAPGGEIFRLTNAITIPGAEIEQGRIVPRSITAEVVADRPGEAYNIGPGEFRIPGFFGSPKYDGFTARSAEPFRGGFRGEATVITAQDLEGAQQELTKRLVEKLGRELTAKVPADQDFIMLNGSRQVRVTGISAPKAGERAQQFRVDVRGFGSMIIFRKTHLAEFLRASSLREDSGARPTLEQPKLSFSNVRLDAEGDRLSFSVRGALRYFRRISETDLERIFSVSTPRKIESHLREREEVRAFRIKKFPAWLWFVPKRSGGVKVMVEEPRG